MKLWLSLLFLLVACGRDGLEPKQTESSASGSRPTSSISRVRDTGAGIHTIETSQRRIDTAPAASAAANAKSPNPAARAGSSASASNAAARKREPESEPRASSAPQRSSDGEDAGPAQRDAGAKGASGEPSVMMSGAAGVAGAAGAAGMSGDPNMPVMSAMNTGSCCVASDKPGCGTPETQACVCQLQPRCCMAAWDETCTFIVAQKFCQPGVRQCVCGSGMGQWQQTECCAQSWTATCDSVALNKCNAREGCF